MNNRLIAPKVAIRNQALLNLGELKKGESANLVFKTKDEISIDSTNIQILDETVLNQVKDQLTKKRWMITDWKDNHIRATVDIKDNDNLLYMSIPYDKNWVVKVDGKKIKADRVLDDFMGISLSKGSHQIELSFIPKGFLFGSMISLMSLISLLSLELFKKREGIKN